MVDVLPVILILVLFAILGAVLVYIILVWKTYLSRNRVRILQDDDGRYVVQRGRFLLYNHPTFFDQYSVSVHSMFGGYAWTDVYTNADKTCEDIETAITIKEKQELEWEEERKQRRMNKKMKVLFPKSKNEELR